MSVMNDDNSRNRRMPAPSGADAAMPGERHAHPPPDAPAGSPAFPFSPQDALEFMQKMWNPFGVPMPGLRAPGAPRRRRRRAGGMPFPNPAAMFATLDPAEVERKIGELKIIEDWLHDEPEHDADEHQDDGAAEGVARSDARAGAAAPRSADVRKPACGQSERIA